MERRTLPWIRLLVSTILAGAAFFFLASIGDVVELVIVSALLAYLVDPLAGWLESRGMSRLAATSAIFIVFIAALGGFVVYLFPAVALQLQSLQEGASIDRVMRFMQEIERVVESNLSFLGFEDLNLMDSLRTSIAERTGDVVDFLPSLLSMVGNLMLVPFIMFFLIKDGQAIKKTFINGVPNRYFEFTLNVLHKMDVQLGNYLRGQVLDAVLVGLLSILALWLLDVEYFIVIGAFAGFCNMIPYVGPVAGGIAAVAVTFFSGGTLAEAFTIVLAFSGIQLIDNSITHPLVVAKNVKLHPLLILLAVLIGGKFFGFLGLVLAVPVTAVAKVIFVETFDNLKRYRFT